MSRLPTYDTFDDVTDNKIWGFTELMFGTSRYSKHFLTINENSFCSLHYHKRRANEFHILSGKLEILVFYGPMFEKHILTSGNKLSIPSHVPHIFFAHEKTTATEEYFSDRGDYIIEDSDIIRILPGGKDTYENYIEILAEVFRNAIRN